MTTSYDPAVYALASTFLDDHPSLSTEENKHQLALHLQTELESWFRGLCLHAIRDMNLPQLTPRAKRLARRRLSQLNKEIQA